MAEDCIFCKIVRGEIPSNKVYEDDELFAFNDIHPVAPVHFMLIPKQHIASLLETDGSHAALLGRMLTLAPQLAREQGLQVKQFNAVQGNELWLDWLQAPSEDPEQKLAILARWILDAEAQGLTYGLRLPGLELAPASGMAQRDDCLRAVALFGLEAK